MSIQIFSTICLVTGLVITLYKNWLKPSLAFVLVVFAFVILKVISIEDFLLGLANKQIILIFLLIILTSGIQQNLGKGFFYTLFNKMLSPFQFRLRMMLTVSGLSSMLNNTPVVAFMIPYVKNWSESNGYSASKFLIPLSFATILGGMITIVGTSTNLVLNGLIVQSGLPSLNYSDFLFLGGIVTVLGLSYLAFFSEKLLPNTTTKKESLLEHLNEYLVETKVNSSSALIGKTIEEAGLRHLKDLFLVEIKRGERSIAAVSSDRIIHADDVLFFAGNTHSILDLINDNNGLELPETTHLVSNGFSALTEAVIPSGSDLVGVSLKDLGFRDKYKASVISVYRKGEKVKENLGEIKLKEGDLLLLLCSKDFSRVISIRDLIVLSKSGEVQTDLSFKKTLPSILSIGILLIGIFGFIDLFLAAFIGILVMTLSKVINLNQIKSAIDVDLLIILVSALAVGVAIQKSGSASFLVQQISGIFPRLSPIGEISILFLLTLGLTTLITNAAAVSIMFPVAYEMGLGLGENLTPYFIAIAFAASADFMTPIGYQTNLMVLGPGNYKFSDYTRIGLPLTIIYSSIVISFIYLYYF
ncbi:SLC13 family permease [Algoriphagus halophilus]|uniref:Di-and tricarboxylate transporter n=1 Tax=Algoriphagus halophilus TaxID=226505 RepID=A0A1N6E9F9_9BACT|nr:Di-and tricarboxylate transporter [Algoriphagus halophilus]